MEYWDIVDEKGIPTGRKIMSGSKMQPGEYHPAVSVWIVNSRGEFLISRRVATAEVAAGMWETTSGSVLAGETPLGAAVRETKEELGIDISPENAILFTSYTWPHSSGDGAAHFTVWIFRTNADISRIKLQTEETCDAMWASAQMIREFITEKRFIGYTYIDELFRFVAEG